MNYHDVKNQELKNTKDFSDKKLERYIKAHKVLLNLSSEFFFWFLSFVVFMLFSLESILVTKMPDSFYIKLNDCL
jgi:hypothetical protein